MRNGKPTMRSLNEDTKQHIVNSFLDLIVLSMLNNKSNHGYGIIADIHIQFGILISPGILYPLLNSLKNEKLVRIVQIERRKIYSLTPLGKMTTYRLIKNYKKNIESLSSYLNANMLRTDETLANLTLRKRNNMGK